MPHYTNTAQTEVRWLDSVDEETQYLPRGFAQITDAEADTIRAVLQAAYMDSLTYTQKRIAEYPPMADYLDGVVKGDQAQIDKYIADCQAVKAKYPKG
jgi:hypothetical protein